MHVGCDTKEGTEFDILQEKKFPPVPNPGKSSYGRFLAGNGVFRYRLEMYFLPNLKIPSLNRISDHSIPV